MITKKIKTDNVTKLKNRLNKLMHSQIRIGIFGEDDSFITMIATVNEFGKIITPTSSRYLTVPVNKKAHGKKAGEIKGLYVADFNGELFLVKNKGKSDFEVYFWLTKKVEIPERSFIRGSYDANKYRIARYVDMKLGQYLTFKISDGEFWNSIGEYLVSLTKEYMTDLKSPPNSSATLASKTPKNNPLIDSGRLRNAIVWKLELR